MSRVSVRADTCGVESVFTFRWCRCLCVGCARLRNLRVQFSGLAGAPRSTAVILFSVDASAASWSSDGSRSCASRPLTLRRGRTLGTGYGLIAAKPSAVLVRRGLRSATLQCVAAVSRVRLPDWQNSLSECMVLSSLLVLARFLAPRLKASVARCWSVVSATRRWRAISPSC